MELGIGVILGCCEGNEGVPIVIIFTILNFNWKLVVFLIKKKRAQAVVY